MSTGIFNPDHYPTPAEVAAEMLDSLDLRGRVVLEPSAGSGNLVRECLERGAAEVIWCEPEKQLRSIIYGMNGRHIYLLNDFLRVEADFVSHVDLIVMNPPFSADEAHILHAWEIAPPGCEIVALCNWNTVCDEYVHRLTQRTGSGLKKQLAYVVNAYGSRENLGECFATAERPTRVSVGLVRLTKPGSRAGADEFDGFFLGPDDIDRQLLSNPPFRAAGLQIRTCKGCKSGTHAVGYGNTSRPEAPLVPTAFPTMKTILTTDWAPYIHRAIHGIAATCAVVYTAGLLTGEFVHRLNDQLAAWVSGRSATPATAAPAPVVSGFHVVSDEAYDELMAFIADDQSPDTQNMIVQRQALAPTPVLSRRVECQRLRAGGMTQQQIADALGCSRTTVRRELAAL
jgi:predicted RNA methylase